MSCLSPHWLLAAAVVTWPGPVAAAAAALYAHELAPAPHADELLPAAVALQRQPLFPIIKRTIMP